MVDIPLTDEIKALGVSRVEITNDYLYLYNGKSFAQCRYYKNELKKTLSELQEEMLLSGNFGDQNTVGKIIFLLSDMYVDSQKQKQESAGTGTTGKNGNSKGKGKEKTESYGQVYKLPGLMAEAILVGETPLWLVTEGHGRVTVAESIDKSENEILKPFPRSSYINRPYVFKTLQEVKELIRVSENGKETLDTLYLKVKGVWKKYIKESDDHLSICSADCIFSYFQDKMGLTHYLFFVGDNDSGKSNNLHIINFLAYRNMLSSDMTAANIYSFLGCEYEGLGTICEDEADNIDRCCFRENSYYNIASHIQIKTNSSVSWLRIIIKSNAFRKFKNKSIRYFCI